MQRSDDDDRSSDRKDGALEEQIERLQEKVESAQSEQKNLFLVIFQVKLPLENLSQPRAIMSLSCLLSISASVSPRPYGGDSGGCFLPCAQSLQRLTLTEARAHFYKRLRDLTLNLSLAKLTVLGDS